MEVLSYGIVWLFVVRLWGRSGGRRRGRSPSLILADHPKSAPRAILRFHHPVKSGTAIRSGDLPRRLGQLAIGEAHPSVLLEER